MRYYSELRFFNDENVDYVHITFNGRKAHTARSKAVAWWKRHYKDEKCKINTFASKSNPVKSWCIESYEPARYGGRGRVVKMADCQ